MNKPPDCREAATPGHIQTKNTRMRYILPVVITYTTMFLFGLIDNLKAVTLPLIKAEFAVTYDAQGGMVSISGFGYTIFCVLAGLCLSRFGIKNTLILSYLLLCAGVLSVYLAPSFFVITVAFFIVNGGFGFVEIGFNALATVTFTKKSALLMNLMHFFFGVGSIVGPKAVGLFAAAGFGWRAAYVSTMLPSAALLLAVALTKLGNAVGRTSRSAPTARSEKPLDGFETPEHPAPRAHPAPYTFVSALRSKEVWLFGVMLGFMAVLEVGTVSWSALYLHDVYGMDPIVEGASFVSLFFIFFTLSRLCSGFAIEKIGYGKSLLMAAACNALCLLCGFGLGVNGIWILPVTGFFIGPLWPTAIALAMRHFKEKAPLATGAMIVIAGAVISIGQYAIGLTNQYIGNAWGYRSCVLYTLLVILTVCLVRRKMRRADV